MAVNSFRIAWLRYVGACTLRRAEGSKVLPIFLLVSLVALVVTWLTVAYQSIKAALADPVKALRYE